MSHVQKAKSVSWCHELLSAVTVKHPVTEVKANFEQLLFMVKKKKIISPKIKHATTDGAQNSVNSFDIWY